MISRILTIVIILAIGVFIGAKNPGLIAKVGL
jgi:hypothetical protein